MEEIYFDIPFEITDVLETRIAEAFQVYDHNNVNMVEAQDVGSIIRSLGCVPSEDDIRNIVRTTEFSDHPGDVHLSKFMPCLKEMLIQQKMKMSPPEDVLEAFKLLDPEDDGFINMDLFKETMMKIGEPMTEKQLEIMMKAAVDPSDPKIYYEAYTNQLCNEPKDSIYELAASYAKPRKSGKKNIFNVNYPTV